MRSRGSSPVNRNEFRMKKTWLALAVLCSLASSAAFAQDAAEGRWMVRARAVHLDSVNKDSTGLGLSINDKVLPEVDFTYFFSPNIAAELILTVPQKQDIRADGLGKIGMLKHLPPALLAQYHFTQFSGFKPYVGAGINYTRFSSVRFNPAVQAALSPTIDKSSWGAALQVGVDIPLSKNLYLNFDVKKVFIETDVFSAGNKVGTLKINPVLAGVGLGWRF